MKTLIMSLLLIAASFSFSFASSQATTTPPPKWELLGNKVVDHKIDRDVIPVTLAEGRFRALKFKVKRADVRFLDVKVHYANGSVEDIKLRSSIAAGGETRVINLQGNKRVITKVVFYYKTRPTKAKRAVVQLWGRH